MRTLRNDRQLLRRSWLWTLLLVATTAWARTDVVTHSFADADLYGNKTPQLYFADLSATDIPAAATNLGLEIDINADIHMKFVYDATKVTGTNRPRTVGLVNGDTRSLYVYGNNTAANRVRLVFSSPTKARIKSLRIDGRTSTLPTSYASYAPSEGNTLLTVDGKEVTNGSGISYALKGSTTTAGRNYFTWEGDAETVVIEKTTNEFWYLRSFTIEYEPDDTKARVPTITGNPNPFLTQSTVTIGSDDQGAAYYYTTDGTTPTEASIRYVAPFTISATTTIKAIAHVSGKINSDVGTATIEKLNVRESITDLNQNATSPLKEYVQLRNAVVTWITSDSIFIQDPTNDKNAGLLLLSGTGSTSLHEGDQVTGIVTGSYSPYRNQLSQWSFMDGNEVTIRKGGVAPVANVELADIASPAKSIPSGVYEDKDYLYQRVRLVTKANSVGAAWYGELRNATVVNALLFGQTGVQIVLPASNPDIVVGGEYGFTGIPYEYEYVVNGTSGFRTLHVIAPTDVTSAEGLPLGSLTLSSYSARLILGDEWQIGIAQKSHDGVLTYQSSNEQVVSVDDKGLVTAVGVGKATVTVVLASNGVRGPALQHVEFNVFQPVYQLPNSDFAQWEEKTVVGGYWWEPVTYTGREPVAWKGYVGTGSNESQMSRNTDGSVHLTGALVENVHYPGLLTTGRHYVVPTVGQVFTPQYNNAYVMASEAEATEFTGLPDALRVVLKGRLVAGNARIGCVLYTPGTMAYPLSNLTETDTEEELGTVIATAELTGIDTDDEWQELVIPFNYEVTDGTRPAYALLSIVTNATPATGTPSTLASEYLDVKSITMDYGDTPMASIGQLTLDGQNIATYVATIDVEFPNMVEAYIVRQTTTDAALLTPVSTAAEGEAVILLGKAGTYELKPSHEARSYPDNLLHVSDGTNATGSDIYALGTLGSETEVAFHRYTGSRSLSAGRVFLKVGNEAGARSLRIAMGDEATLGIQQPTAAPSPSSSALLPLYDLQGRKASTPKSGGIYIVGDKKVAIK